MKLNIVVKIVFLVLTQLETKPLLERAVVKSSVTEALQSVRHVTHAFRFYTQKTPQ